MNNVLFSRFFNIYRALRITLSLIVLYFANAKDNISLVCFLSISHTLRIEFHFFVRISRTLRVTFRLIVLLGYRAHLGLDIIQLFR